MAARLPKGWKRRELGELVEIQSGGTPSRSNPAFWDGYIPWISAKDLKTFDLLDSQDRLTDAGAKQANMVPEGCVLILVRGMGLFKDVPVGVTSRPMAFNQDLKALHPKAGIRPRFLAYSLQAQRHNLMEKVDVAGHGTGRLSTDILEELPLLFPPYNEQNRIVAVLEACKRLHQLETERLARLTTLRRGLLIKLLSKRDSKTQTMALSDAVEIRLSGVDKKSVQDEQPVQLCNYMDVFYNERIDGRLDFMAATASQTEISRFTLQKGDVLLTKDSEVADEIAECAVVAADLPGVLCGYHMALLRPDQAIVSGEYLAIALRNPTIRHQFARNANGVTRFGLTRDAFDQIEISIPILPQQERVVMTYTALSDRIATTKQLIAALGQQQRGLMQKLLSGQWRLTRDLPGMAHAHD